MPRSTRWQRSSRHSTPPQPRTRRAKLLMTGPGVFSVTSREAIKSEVSTPVDHRHGADRNPVAAGLSLRRRAGAGPAAGGVRRAGGVAAVSAGFRLGARDHAGLRHRADRRGRRLFDLPVRAVGNDGRRRCSRSWVRRFWPTIRLGVLTSVAGFASLLLSGFPGLAQLGLYAIAGLFAAAVVTRFVLPHCCRADSASTTCRHSARPCRAGSSAPPLLRWGAVLVLLAACVVLLLHREQAVELRTSLRLSPVSQADRRHGRALARRHGRAGRALPGGGVGTGPRSGVALVGAGRGAAASPGGSRRAGRIRKPQPLPAQHRHPARAASQPARAAGTAGPLVAGRSGPAGEGIAVRAFRRGRSGRHTQPLLQPHDLDSTSMAMALQGAADRAGSAMDRAAAAESAAGRQHQRAGRFGRRYRQQASPTWCSST